MSLLSECSGDSVSGMSWRHAAVKLQNSNMVTHVYTDDDHGKCWRSHMNIMNHHHQVSVLRVDGRPPYCIPLGISRATTTTTTTTAAAAPATPTPTPTPTTTTATTTSDYSNIFLSTVSTK